MFLRSHVFIRKKSVGKLYYSIAMQAPSLRKYQEDCIEISLKELKQGCTRQVVSLPVGSGKTVIMSNFIPRIPSPTPEAKKVLLLAHRQELLNQASNQIKRFNSNLIVEIDQGKRMAQYDRADVIVASVPTLGRATSKRLDNIDPSQFKAVLIDEAHHAVADSYLNIIEHFKDHPVLIWGCSATVRRHDGLSLSDVFDKITFHMDFLDLIEQRHLSPMRVTTVKTKTDISSVRIQGSDFSISQLSNAVNTPTRNEIVLLSWKKYAQDEGRKCTLVFAVDIQHTVDLCNMFREQGIEAEFVTSKTPDMTRHQIIERFKNGEIPVLINCAILTEGTDIPSVDCILMARPTKSATLFQQMFGRGLRLHEGKDDCLIVDFVDNFHKGGKGSLVTIPTLLGLKAEDTLEDENILDLEKKARLEEEEKNTEKTPLGQDRSKVNLEVTEYDSLNELLSDLSVSVDIKHATKNDWVNIGQNKYVLYVLHQGYLILEKSEGSWKGNFKVEVRGIYAKTYPIPLVSDELVDAIRAADTWVTKKFGNGGRLHGLLRDSPYRKKPMSEAQRKAITKHGIDASNMNRGDAKDILTRVKFGDWGYWTSRIKAKEKERKKSEENRMFPYLKRVGNDEISFHVSKQ
ncbi:P-loop containing nucleoside triphosphate hydrolase protein [Sporodiniella umbellata]|nr:P-loop containing nucleoside triphosphate hydrolase protein [Sporodiniella umbellata]